jgi:hypothetical protein
MSGVSITCATGIEGATGFDVLTAANVPIVWLAGKSEFGSNLPNALK